MSTNNTKNVTVKPARSLAGRSALCVCLTLASVAAAQAEDAANALRNRRKLAHPMAEAMAILDDVRCHSSPRFRSTRQYLLGCNLEVADHMQGMV